MQPDQKYLLENIRYEDGIVFWIKKRHKRNRLKPVGYPLGNGYRVCWCLGKMQLMHRLIWIYHHGPIPKNKQIDHIDGDRANNKISNLRLVTSTYNQRNRAMSRNNTTGQAGVQNRLTYWHAYIGVRGKVINLGSHKTFAEAVLARKSAEKRYGFSERHGVKTALYPHTRDIYGPKPKD